MCPDDYERIGPGFEVGKDNCYEGRSGPDKLDGTDKGDCIEGRGGNDSIRGLGGNDQLDGGVGNDTLYGGAGDDELTGGSGNNMLHGGDGTDIAVYKDAMRVVADLSKNQANVRHSMPEDVDELGFTARDSGTGTDNLMEIENVKGSLAGEDILTGDENANVLKGLDGADTLDGGDGDDTLLPNRPAEMDAMGDPIANAADSGATPPEVDGIDDVDGGEGSDTISYEGESAAVTVDLAAVVARADGPDGTANTADDIPAHVAAAVDGAATDRIELVNRGTAEEPRNESTIENVRGGFGGDTLTGDVRGNVLTGGAGADTLNGDALSVEGATAAATFDALTKGGNDTLNGGADGDTLNGGAGADMLNGGAGDDTLNGNAGNDILDGGAGNDALDGGAGNDQFIITKGDGGDTIATFAAGDRITLKGFGGSGNVKLNMTTAGVLQDVDPDDSTDVTTLVTITAGFGAVRLTTDIDYVD